MRGGFGVIGIGHGVDDAYQGVPHHQVADLVPAAHDGSHDGVGAVALVLHSALMRNLGVTLTQIADLEKLAADCAEDGRYEFLYVAAPLKVAKGSGAPVNPVAIK